MKRIVTIQDISCFGKCSITVSLPIISAMGVECCIVPTSVLSTHTSGFTGYTFCDISSQLLPIAEHWRKEGIVPDVIYTGYLGSPEQIDLVLKFIDLVRGEDTRIFVDPAMADGGRLYPGFAPDFPSHMMRLCAIADAVCPNITEASLLLGADYREAGEYDEEYIRSLVRPFVERGVRDVVVTGVKYGDGRHGALAYDAAADRYEYIWADDQPASFHGTGDVFSSVLCGSLAKGADIYGATREAVDFTVACIKRTMPDRETHSYGVKFEECLGLLTK